MDITNKPWQETEADLIREEIIAKIIERKWGCSCYKLHPQYHVDYWAEMPHGGKWIEIKCRSFGFEKYDELIVSTSKLKNGAQLAMATGHPFVIVFCLTDGVWYHQWSPYQKYDIRFMVHEKSRFTENSEPYTYFAKDMLECLSDKPVVMDRSDLFLKKDE